MKLTSKLALLSLLVIKGDLPLANDFASEIWDVFPLSPISSYYFAKHDGDTSMPPNHTIQALQTTTGTMSAQGLGSESAVEAYQKAAVHSQQPTRTRDVRSLNRRSSTGCKEAHLLRVQCLPSMISLFR